VVLSTLNRQHDDVQTLRRQAERLLRRRSKEGAQDSAAMVQKLADLPPYQRVWVAQSILGATLLAGSSPVEIAVPVLRVFLRQRGVQTGAAAGTLLAFLASHAYTTAIRRQLATEASADGEDQNNPWFDRWVTRAILCGALVLPAVGGVLPGAVVLHPFTVGDTWPGGLCPLNPNFRYQASGCIGGTTHCQQSISNGALHPRLLWGRLRLRHGRSIDRAAGRCQTRDVIFALLLIIGIVGGTVWLFIDLRRQLREGWVACALRSPDRPLHGMGAKWRHGSAKADRGVLTFRTGGPGGARFPRGVPFEIPVLGARELSGQRPGLRQAWSLNPALHMAVVETPDGELEVAAMPEDVRCLVSGLSPEATVGSD
jgi:hypothetical protein